MAEFDFNPERVAYFEASGWRAYYDRNWLRLFRLIAALCREQFSIPFPMSLIAAYTIARASAAWVAVDHDGQAVLTLLERFYRMAKRYSGLTFNPRQVAALEERYWDVHRRLSGQPDKTDFIETLVDLHHHTFGLSREQAHESAELRVAANNTVDRITSGASTDPEADWASLEDDLRRCYLSIRQALKDPVR